jgi:iron complex outermembrane receptor protein
LENVVKTSNPFRLMPLARALSAAGAAWLSLSPALAQEPAASPNATLPATRLPEVTVTANPLSSELFELVTPASVLHGRGLVLRRASTVGETLDRLPGVSQSQFGPNASRPVIRGLDGDRIRVLQNSTGMLDASSLSFDHAVAADPLTLDRVEVVRGPAALLYGGNAVGGVVNLIDRRIPTESPTAPTGAVELRGGGPARERSGAGMLDIGAGPLAFHADVHRLETSDLKIPGRACTAAALFCPDAAATGRLPNSAAKADGGAVGASYVAPAGYFGAAYSVLSNAYGTVKEPGVGIRLDNRRWDLAGEWRGVGLLRSMKFKGASTDYKHEEVETETGAIGTTFVSKGYEARLEAAHGPVGGLEGAIGMQLAQTRFSALGDEAFVPDTRTRSQALFVFEEAALNASLKANAGLRLERVEVDSAGSRSEETEARFGAPAGRRFNAVSTGAGVVWKWNAGWSVAGNLASSERAPTFYELFANGPHVATGVFEVGDPTLRKERSRALDVSLRHADGPHRFSIDLYVQRFANYLSQLATGELADVEGELLPIYRFTPVRARLHGAEIQLLRRLANGPHTIDLEWQGQLARGANQDSGEALPRLPPFKMTTALAWSRGPWGARAEWVHAARQKRVPQLETPTDGYDWLNLDLSYRWKAGGADTLVFLKLENLGNQEARLATSFLRDIAPLGGRSLKLGLRSTF